MNSSLLATVTGGEAFPLLVFGLVVLLMVAGAARRVLCGDNSGCGAG